MDLSILLVDGKCSSEKSTNNDDDKGIRKEI